MTQHTRRQRHLAEIAALVAAGNLDRGGDLALVHLAEFPNDEELLTQLVGPKMAP